ncbi:hypothetical protein AB8880_05865 [Alphaproteobacteria bacterium LSUCC0684]
MLEIDAQKIYEKGKAFIEQELYFDALVEFEKLYEVFPDNLDIFNAVCICKIKTSNPEQAYELLYNSIKSNKFNSDLLLTFGNLLFEREQISKALNIFSEGNRIYPENIEFNYGIALVKEKQYKFSEALEIYDNLININNNDYRYFANRGTIHLSLQNTERSIKDSVTAIKLNPDDYKPYITLSLAYSMNNDLKNSQDILKNAKIRFPDNPIIEVEWINRCLSNCDWTFLNYKNYISSKLGITSEAITPLPMISIEDCPEGQFKRSLNWAKLKFKYQNTFKIDKSHNPEQKLKIGFFSSDIREHPVMYLIMGLLREYDKTKNEIYIYSYKNDSKRIMQRKVAKLVDHFFDIESDLDEDVVDLVRSHDLDVAIDLNGYTAHSRSNLFKDRIAPVQINFLGYPSTMGADFIDYIIADKIIIPDTYRKFYSEKIIYMPHCFQPNDNLREFSTDKTDKAGNSLPEKGFVFCCFNNTNKISSSEFDIWMKILLKVDGSVLWLLKSNNLAEDNLKKEAEKRGVNPARIIFAERVPSLSEHLERLQHADLFIDTFNYNAHTTASDALWAGLPIVTKQGKQYAARVASSLLNAVGLAELITFTEKDYENKIIELALNPVKLSAVKDKLSSNKLNHPLFDTNRYARNFEDGLRQAVNAYIEKTQYQDITVKDLV